MTTTSTTPTSEVNSEKILRYEAATASYGKAADHCIDVIEKAQRPFWKSSVDFAKLLVPLASAALVLTVNFSKEFLTADASQFSRVTMFVSWLCFCLSTAGGLISLWTAIRFDTLRIELYNQKEEAIKKILEEYKDGEPRQRNLEDIFLIPLSRLKRYTKVSELSLTGGLIMFVIALILLSVVGLEGFRLS